MVVTDHRVPDAPIVYVNAAFERMTGYGLDEVVGRNCRFLQGKERRQAGVRTIRSALERGEACRVLIRNYRKDGRPFWNDLHLSPVLDDGGRPGHYLGVQVVVPDGERPADDGESAGMIRSLRETLERKDVALREMLSRLQEETAALRERVDMGLVSAVYPFLNALQPHLSGPASALLAVLRRNVAALTSAIGGGAASALPLTARERVVCQLIRQGAGTKEIARICCVSPATVENQRNAVRRKLGIAGKEVNLAAYLQSLPDAAFNGAGLPGPGGDEKKEEALT